MNIARQTLTAITCGLLVAITTAPVLSAEPPWELLQQNNDISIYSRPVDGSSYNEVKATALINAPLTHVSTFLGDGNGCAKWRTKCKSSKVIKPVSEHERYVYMVLDLPWPATDRDMIVHTTTHIDTQAKTATVNLQSSSSHHPPSKFVRAETSGQIVIRAVSDTQVEFTYTMHTELGGSLPAGRVNGELADGAFEDLSLLRQLAER
ncbi:MAG: hypothetical protein ACJAZ0_002271 [Halioglobus sp.]|jgi:hypothetical protein